MIDLIKIMLITFAVSVFLFIVCIKAVKKLQFGQVVRNDGPESHLKKNGTPTMGGIVFIIVFLLAELLLYNYHDFENNNRLCNMNLFIIAFGLIGFIDDFLKVSKKNTDGLKSRFKFLLQVILSAIGIYICFNNSILNNVFIFLFTIFIIVGTNNGVNFTDGLDGLCGFVTLIISVFYFYISYKQNNAEFMAYNMIMIVTLVSFLLFNHYPAKLFMGDTGSLFLGAYVAFMGIALNLQYKIPLYGFVYMMEVISVILQVSYFKLTKGKRLFKMAPIHHHFEKCGFSENSVVLIFAILTIIGCTLTLLML